MTRLTENEAITRDSYTKTSGQWNDGHGTKKFWGKNFDEFYKLLPKGRVLEIGCGAGRDAQELIEHGYEYLGTDISEGMIKEAKKRLPGHNFKQKSVYDLSYSDKFDGFWAAACLIHVPKPRIDEALQAIKNSIKPGAIGFISMKEGIGDILEQRESLDNKKFYFVFWQNDEFKETLRKNGFKILHEDYIPMSERTKWLCYIVKSV